MSTLSPTQIAGYASQAGFSGNGLAIATAIALAESGGNTQAYNPETAAGTPLGSGSRGLWQIYGKAHPQYNNDSLYDPLTNARAAYVISNRGASFTPWSTYNSGAYRQYMTVNTGTTGTPTTSGVQISSASSNTYPKGQCTWWACQRYHDLTGYYVPWKANAKDWASAATQAQGWSNSTTATIPSIVVMQAGVQLADPTYGHVGIVERINSDGSVYCSMQNWAGITYPNTTYATIYPGRGISFVTANVNAPGNGGFQTVSTSYQTDGTTFPTLLSQVHNTLINTPGFYGIALAVDEAEQFTGWVDLTQPQKDISIVGQDTGFAPPDFIGIIRSIGATITDNIVPFAIRSTLVMLGLILLILLLARLVSPIADKVAPFIAAGEA